MVEIIFYLFGKNQNQEEDILLVSYLKMVNLNLDTTMSSKGDRRWI